VPKSKDWVSVPGKPECKWRRSPQDFKYGTNGEEEALYFDVSFSSK